MIFKNDCFVFYLSAIFCFTELVPSISAQFPLTNEYNVTKQLLPKSFKLGVATSAGQIEGAWNQSGKSVSILDNFFFQYSEIIVDNSTAEIVSDSYNKYLEDIELMKDIKTDVYRFSIPWTRILPSGFINYINWEAVDHYNNLIDGLLAVGIEPYVTMVHFENPLDLNDLGGWTQPKMVDYFVDYADLLFSLFGDRVKTWITINEPMAHCVLIPDLYLGNVGRYATFGHTEYFCLQNMLKAHAKAYRLYEKKYKKDQKGRIAVSNLAMLTAPNGTIPTPEEQVLMDRANNFIIDLFWNPIFIGDWPRFAKDAIAKKSREQGFKESRLPKFTAEEIKEIKGTVDFMPISIYGTFLLQTDLSNYTVPSFADDKGSTLTTNTLGLQVDNYRKVLRYIRDRYNNPEIVIIETGHPEDSLNDTFKATYIQVMVSESIKAKQEDDINISSFIFWTLLDNIEFINGLTYKMGLYAVDFNDPNRTRTPRLSAEYFRKVIETRCLVEKCY